MASPHDRLFIVMLLMLAAVQGATCTVINVSPTSSNCSQVESGEIDSTFLQTALADLQDSDTLVLEPGCHHLTELHSVVNLTNITITGSGPNDTFITCDGEAGLAFISTNNLMLNNFTVLQCNITGNALNDVIADLRSDMSHEKTFAFPAIIEIAVIVGQSVNLSLSNVRIQDTHGIGLLLSDVLGKVIVDSVAFTGNYDRRCYRFQSELGYGIGGGMVVLFNSIQSPVDDAVTAITNSLFEKNSYCGYSTTSQVYAGYFSNLFSEQGMYDIGGGGGLTAYFAQNNYSVTFNVANCTFKNNTAPYGGGIYFGAFVGAQQVKLDIADSKFSRNGLDRIMFDNITEFRHIGQGVAIIQDISFPSTHNPLLSVGTNSYVIRNCQFLNNNATVAAGLCFYSRYITISPSTTFLRVDNCKFENNKATYAVVTQLVEEKFSGTQAGTEIIFNSCTFHSNEIITNSDLDLASFYVPQGSSIMDLTSINVTFLGSNNFTNNIGTPVRMITSILNIVNKTMFANNTGVFGGAIAITSSSFIVLKAGSNLSFLSNEAFIAGGAIYTQTIAQADPSYFYDCFLYIEQLDSQCDAFDNCFDPTELGITVHFSGNQATLGSVVYGSTLITCPWLKVLEENKRNESLDYNSSYEFLEQIGVFHFDQKTLTTDFKESFATPIKHIEVDPIQTETVMPGQRTTINVTAYDYFDKVSATALSSATVDNQVNGPHKSQLGDSGFAFIDTELRNVSVSVLTMQPPNSSQNSNITVAIYGTDNHVTRDIYLVLRDCYPGFKFDKESTNLYKQCICDPQLDVFNIECDANDAVMRVPNGYWVGAVNGDRLTIHRCVFDYCRAGGISVTNGNFSQQCSEGFHRTGILCGECKDGYSIQWGTNACDKCSNYHLFLILYFAFAGFAVVLIIGRLGLTVSSGHINCILFYCNVVTPFLPYMIPRETDHQFSILISMINLNMGFHTCFFNGMTALSNAFLSFAFPVYLWLLLGVYTVLIRKNKLRWLCKQYPAPVFASVILVSYTSTLQACINALSVLDLDNARHPLRWAVDPTVKYFQGWHVALALLSLLHMVMYIIPVPILLLFPALTLRTSFGKKWIPIYDAFWAPFREKFHFWVGLRLLVRVIPLVLSSFLPAPHNILGLGIFAVVYLVTQIYFKPFKSETQCTRCVSDTEYPLASDGIPVLQWSS